MAQTETTTKRTRQATANTKKSATNSAAEAYSDLDNDEEHGNPLRDEITRKTTLFVMPLATYF